MKHCRVWACWLPLCLVACGTPVEPQHLSPSAAEAIQLRGWVPAALRGQVSVGTVEGGQATSVFWGSKVSDEALRIALDDALRATGMLSLQGPGARYELRVKLLKLEQPRVAVDVQVVAYLDYRLVDRVSGETVYQRQIRSAEEAPLSSAYLNLNERMRLANEAALKRSVMTLLRELVELRY